MSRRIAALVSIGIACCACHAYAAGEAVGNFPNWAERVLFEWTNRARSDPQVEMTACGANCGDGACYGPIAPLSWSPDLAHAARFHVDNMVKMNYFGHTSACTLMVNIGAAYPYTCDGSASCACVGGVSGCSPTCTDFSSRVALFGANAEGESLAGGFADPDAAFYARLFEMSPSGCGLSLANSDRWVIFSDTGLLGTGLIGAGLPSNLEFGFGSATTSKIPSGAHFPQQAASVDAWANWYDTAGPSIAKVDVDGICTDMTLSRGAQTNGAWHASISGVGSGCHRYFFAFKDSGGSEVLYPGKGSLTIGNSGALCPDYSLQTPRSCAGFERIFADSFDP